MNRQLLEEALQKVDELQDILHKLYVKSRRGSGYDFYDQALVDLTGIERKLKNHLQYFEKEKLVDWKEGNPIRVGEVDKGQKQA